MTPGGDGAARAAQGASAPVVVTGAAGFVGRALCAHFAAAGRPHRAIVRDLPPGVARVATRIALGDLATVPVAQLTAALEGAAAVVHLAGRAHALVEPAAETEYHAANVTATERLAAAAVAAGVRRFVLASTVKVYGEATPPGRPWRAGDPPDPADAYARSKLAAERALAAACAGGAMTPIVLRFPLVYGPGVGANFLALLEAVARRAPLPLRSIANRRDLCYVGNLAHAIAALIDCVDPPAATWLVADGEAVSTPELVRRLAAALGVAPRLLPAPVALLRIAGALTGRGARIARLTGSLEVDVSPLVDRIGPLPYTLDDGLAATVRWWQTRHAI
jgi:nucleoside-diphosphate-sugar epimerase